LIVPAIQNLRCHPSWKQARFGCGTKDDTGIWCCRTGDFTPEGIELLVIHPVLRIQQDITVDGCRRLGSEKIGIACVLYGHAISACPYRFEVGTRQIGRERPGLLIAAIAASERLPGEIIVGKGETASEFLKTAAQDKRHVAVS